MTTLNRISLEPVIDAIRKGGAISSDLHLHIVFPDNNFNCPDLLFHGPRGVEQIVENFIKRADEINALVDRQSQELVKLIEKQNKEDAKWPTLFS